MDAQVKNWLDSARYDLDTAAEMSQAGRYPYVIFFCHLALEKALKAKIQEITGRLPPKVHNLRRLLQLSGLDPPEDLRMFLSRLSDVSIPTRYPEDLAQLLEAYSRSVAEDYLRRSQEALQWISALLKP